MIHTEGITTYKITCLIFEGKLFITCLLLAPTILYVFVYAAIFALMMSIGLMLFEMGDIDNTQFLEYLSQVGIGFLAIIIVAFALQKRELDRFYELRKSKLQTG